MSQRVGVGVIGGSGYIGAEILRYLCVHPRVEVCWVTANRNAGEPVASVLPNLGGFVDATFGTLDEGIARLDETRAVFVCLPHNQSQDVIPALVEKAPDTIFIDLGGDFRTKDSEGYRRYYKKEHTAPELLERFVYGFTEYRRDALASAKLIANPGCFATTLNLGLAPLAARGVLDGKVFVTALTGSSGSGNSPSATTHHPERAANVRAYKPLVHQHILEVESFLRTLTDKSFQIKFVPQSGPYVRGIFATIFVPGVNEKALLDIFEDAYGGEPLIHVVKGSPELRWVQATPRSCIGVGSDGADSVVFSVTDNLGKGAAGQALQNFNLAIGFEETEGLRLPGGFV